MSHIPTTRRLWAIGRRSLAWAIIASVSVAVAVSAQVDQVEQEDLPEPEMSVWVAGAPIPLDATEAADLDEVEAALANDLPGLEARRDAAVEQLEALVEAGNPTPEARRRLARLLGWRARDYMRGGDQFAGERDLARAVDVDPSFQADPRMADGRRTLVDLVERLREARVGTVRFQDLDPPDLALRIDGRLYPITDGTVEVTAGLHTFSARRPGYTPWQTEVEVRADQEVDIPLVLERSSAILRLVTRPAGATVWVDDQPRGSTVGAGDAGPGTPSAPGTFSIPLVLTELPMGRHTLEVRSPGHRSYRVVLSIEEPIDYEIPPIALEPERGRLLLGNVPDNATVRVNGQALEPVSRRAGQLRFDLVPGTYTLLVDQGPERMFTRTLAMADRQTIEVDVRLLPGLALHTAVGADARTATRVAEFLDRVFAASSAWTAVDQRRSTARVLQASGLDTPTLRGGPEPGSTAAGTDWSALQRAADQHADGLMHILPVASDDLLAHRVDLLVWPSAPGPPTPDRIAIDLDDLDASARLTAAFSRTVPTRRPWLGVQMLDSDAALHPVVATVTPGSPADSAGLAPGDEIVSVAQVPVLVASAIDQRIRVAEIGETLRLGVRNASGNRTVEVQLAWSPTIVDPRADDFRGAVAFANLKLLESRVPAEDVWTVQLDRARLLMAAGSWVEAARALRAIEAPASTIGVGRATVDYWLGVALMAAGPTYRESAISAFERAASQPDGRLRDHDGPWIAPRARARLSAAGAIER